ncbi:hypothetical protein F5Y17DRAFT_456554 [Xylariaceae sp. FL0594]|nr:hypothetical protein F5Y17DRAFT_456554 [Xylariaceae sp. FL0594]
MALTQLLSQLGPEIEDPEEGMFYIPSQNLGFVDSQATEIDLTINGRDYTVHQSPTILHRPGSTTGAVIWKITPLIAQWLSSPSNLLWATGALSASSTVLELGCGISGLVGLAVSPLVSGYVLTDQPYVARLVERNIEANATTVPQKPGTTKQRKGKSSSSSSAKNYNNKAAMNLRFTPLDWELDEVTESLTGASGSGGFDAVLACDCIYNETLIRPLVQTCADACRLRLRGSTPPKSQSQPQGSSNSNGSSSVGGGRGDDDGGASKPTICIVAQQLRDPEIFEGWIQEFAARFRIWRVPETVLSKELRENSGFVVHVGILKNEA